MHGTGIMTTIAFGMPGPFEWVLIAGLGLLIFGRRLPEVGRSLGRSIVEFKKGIHGIEDELDNASSPSPPTRAVPQSGSASSLNEGAAPPTDQPKSTAPLESDHPTAG